MADETDQGGKPAPPRPTGWAAESGDLQARRARLLRTDDAQLQDARISDLVHLGMLARYLVADARDETERRAALDAIEAHARKIEWVTR